MTVSQVKKTSQVAASKKVFLYGYDPANDIWRALQVDTNGRLVIDPADLDLRYLKLDCSNDPLTAPLSIETTVAGEILTVGDPAGAIGSQAVRPAGNRVVNLGGSGKEFYKGYFFRMAFNQFDGTLAADGDVTRDLGTSAKRWKELFLQTIATDVSLAAGKHITFSQKGVNLGVAMGAPTKTIVFPSTEPDTNYGILVKPSWNSGGSYVISKTTTQCVAAFPTPPSGLTETIDWLLFR